MADATLVMEGIDIAGSSAARGCDTALWCNSGRDDGSVRVAEFATLSTMSCLSLGEDEVFRGRPCEGRVRR